MQTVELVGTDFFGLGALGYGLSDEALDKIAERLYLYDTDSLPALKQEIVNEMRLLVVEDRPRLAQKLIDLGVNTDLVREAMEASGAKMPFWMDPVKLKAGITVWGVLGTVSMVAGIYHGYARNQSIGWGLWWGLMGVMFPIATPTIALAQCKTGPEKRFMLGCRK
jgi:hypothetical protein